MRFRSERKDGRAELEALYRLRFPAFARGAAAVVGDGEVALDVVQDAFAQALRRRRSYRGDGSLEAWVWKIVLNVARDRFRARRRDAAVVHESFTAAEELLDGRGGEVRAVVLDLPERQREAVFLRYYADLTYDEIADVLGVRPGTVAASLNAARRALHERLLQEVEA